MVLLDITEIAKEYMKLKAILASYGHSIVLKCGKN